MEVTRAGEAMLRHAQPLLPFLAPTIARTPSTMRAAAAISRHCSGQRLGIHASRSFSTTYRRREDQGEKPTPEPTPSRLAATESISSLLESHMDPANKASSKSRSGDVLKSYAPRKGSSADDFFNVMSSRSNGPSQRAPTAYSRMDISQMMDPGFNSSGFGVPKSTGPPPIVPDKPFNLKLGPTIGRTSPVDPSRGVDIARAFRNLDALCARNKVRADFNAQRFHERPGLKRKRLRRVRWRRRFKEGFRAIVAKVHKMKKQGW